ncbi:cysteine-rich and transmembrane domain-containing protein 1 [Poecilia formosa]|uniref:Cysteine-rich and transmembrane domain-containing protein 1 n=1 Tax=Poecilia formosa TaxID=48698 RepID=A0A087XPA5_POEFO|nr:PREDICTED: cysteine-rich and transmembrane domain-containing protein 1 [Poecilia formosa]XP_016528327.1 PREDICTED: cysteine-rich and transmembrane domain-containing protein 1 [Poecilia formosa]
MNFEQPPPYPGSGPSAPGYPGQGPPPQGYPPQGYPPQGYPVNMDQPNPAYPNYPAGPGGPGGPYPGPGQPPFQGYPGQPQYAWQGGPPPGPMYGEAPKNTVYVVEDRRRDDTADTCLTACWTALCCCCLWDMLT